MSISRHEFAKEVGRRVSRGQFERAFNRLVPVQLRTTKMGWAVDDKGNVKLDENKRPIRTRYHPTVGVLHEQSPKSKRKHGKAPNKPKSARARFAHAFK